MMITTMKINYITLLVGVILGFIAQVFTFFQLQGSLKYDWFKNNYWLTVFMGIPISMLFMESVKHIVTAYGGQLWPSRLIGFSIGTIVFTWLSWLLFKEPLTMKTMVSLLFAAGILGIQIFWK